MKLRIQTKEDFIDGSGYYYQVEEIEIESFRWGKNHEFEYVVKDAPFWRKLKPNQEIVGLGI